MNSVSLLLYLSNVADNFTGFALFLLVALLIIAAIMLVCAAIAIDDAAYGERREKQKSWGEKFKILLKVSYFVVPFYVLSLLIPNSTTLYMIAASELGESVVVSSETQEILSALKAKILDVLEVEAN